MSDFFWKGVFFKQYHTQPRVQILSIIFEQKHYMSFIQPYEQFNIVDIIFGSFFHRLQKCFQKKSKQNQCSKYKQAVAYNSADVHIYEILAQNQTDQLYSTTFAFLYLADASVTYTFIIKHLLTPSIKIIRIELSELINDIYFLLLEYATLISLQ